MKANNNYRPETRSRYAYHAIMDRIGHLNDVRLIQSCIDRLQRQLHTVSLDEEYERVRQEAAAEAAGPQTPSITYQQEMVRCGKTSCRKCRTTGAAHGPYWYAYWSEGGKTKKRYIGKQLPEQVEQAEPTLIKPETETIEPIEPEVGRAFRKWLDEKNIGNVRF